MKKLGRFLCSSQFPTTPEYLQGKLRSPARSTLPPASAENISTADIKQLRARAHEARTELAGLLVNIDRAKEELAHAQRWVLAYYMRMPCLLNTPSNIQEGAVARMKKHKYKAVRFVERLQVATSHRLSADTQ